jgi:hypothetical protein
MTATKWQGTCSVIIDKGAWKSRQNIGAGERIDEGLRATLIL